MLSDLYSPDDVHALPAINPTDKQQADENEEMAREKNSSGDFADESQADTAMGLKVISTEIFFMLFFLHVWANSLVITFFKLVHCKPTDSHGLVV